MRIATLTQYQSGVTAINQQQAELLKVQQQIASGKRLTSPADDPVAAVQAQTLHQTTAVNTQFLANQATAQDQLGQADNALNQVSNLLTSIRTSVISAGNPGLNAADRATLATTLQSGLEQLLTLANSTDGQGDYLFSGFQSATPPFGQAGDGSVSYQGDQGQRWVQVSASRQMPVTSNGLEVFGRVPTGNGVFQALAQIGNTGSGVMDGGNVVDPSQLTGHAYQIDFSVVAGETRYRVTDTTTGQPVAAPQTDNAYSSGSDITVEGMRVAISGAPAEGDSFILEPSSKQSVFATVQDMIQLLRNPVDSPAGKAALTMGVRATLANLDHGMDKVLSERAAIGSRQNELSALTASSESVDLQLQARLSELEDTDAAQAASDLARYQNGVEVAQKSFSATIGKSLFDYL